MNNSNNPHDQIASFYNSLFSFPKHFDQTLADFIASSLKKTKATILDCGCGSGNPSLGLAQAGHLVIGIDTSRKMLAVARSNAEEIGVSIELRDVPMERLDSLEHTFDCIICHDCLYHFRTYESLLTFFLRLRKSLSNNGIVYIATKKWDSGRNKEDRERLEIRGSIDLGDNRLVVMDICEKNKLAVHLIRESRMEIVETSTFLFSWFPRAPEQISQALISAGFQRPEIVNQDGEHKYGCVGIIAHAGLTDNTEGRRS